MSSIRVPSHEHDDSDCYECDTPIKGTDWCAEVAYGPHRKERPVCLRCWSRVDPDAAVADLALMRGLNKRRAEGVSFDAIADNANLKYSWMVVENERVWPNAALCVAFDRFGAP